MARSAPPLDLLMVRWWHDLLVEPVLSVLFPPRCVGCGDFESYLCDFCGEGLAAVGEESCPRCGEPGPRPLIAGRCSQCMGAEPAYASARSAFVHEGVSRQLVTEFKLGRQPVLGRLMAELARPAFVDYVSAIAPPDRIVTTWVPCHRTAQRDRGYNQAEVLARALAGAAGCMSVAGLTRKIAATKHQKGLGRTGRQANLLEAFVIDGRATSKLPTDCCALLLVDDVFTTGATAGQVSAVLASATGLPVHVFTFSRAIVGAVERHD